MKPLKKGRERGWGGSIGEKYVQTVIVVVLIVAENSFGGGVNNEVATTMDLTKIGGNCSYKPPGAF